MLFKYLPPSRIDVIENRKLRFSSPKALNDPYEERFKLGDTEWEMGGVASRDELMKFVSLSRNPLNLLMWSHYADSHQGYVVGFHRSAPYFIGAETVRYRHLRSNFNGELLAPDKSKNFNVKETLKKLVLEKAIDWSYEEEERLFLQDVPQSITEVGVDSWGEPILLNDFPAKSVACVYLGASSSPQLKEEVICILKQYNHEIPLYQLRMSKSMFALEASTVSYT
ncbi:DUF2971 domain-containing protein [Vibrio vulnificus]